MTSNFTDTLKFLRKQKNMKQIDMVIGTASDNSLYSRLETGKLHIKMQHIEQICDHLEISVSEFMFFSEIDYEISSFIETLRKTVNNHNDIDLKDSMIDYYNQLKKIHLSNLSLKEVAFYFAIKNNLHLLYYDIEKITDDDTDYFLKVITGKTFYSMLDYLAALNIVPYMSSKQVDTIIHLMAPLKYMDKRSPQTKKYANVLLTNAIAMKNYATEYEKALEYIELAEQQDPDFQNYYFRFDIQYHKNIALYFIKKDTEYINKARRLIETIEEIQDIKTAKTYKRELDNIIDNPEYYKKNNSYDIVFVKEQN